MHATLRLIFDKLGCAIGCGSGGVAATAPRCSMSELLGQNNRATADEVSGWDNLSSLDNLHDACNGKVPQSRRPDHRFLKRRVLNIKDSLKVVVDPLDTTP